MLRDKKIGFIGSGNMATALIKGLLKSEKIPAENLYASDVDMDKLEQLSNKIIKDPVFLKRLKKQRPRLKTNCIHKES